MSEKLNKAYVKGISLRYLEDKINGEIEAAFNLICDIVKEKGGLLKTIQYPEKTPLYAYYSDSLVDTRIIRENIHGLRWDDELGLTICTDSMLENYTFDTGYGFEDFTNFEGEDLENLEKVLADPAYFVEFDKYDLNRIETILGLIAGLPCYL
jgi:hypothetical protein